VLRAKRWVSGKNELRRLAGVLRSVQHAGMHEIIKTEVGGAGEGTRLSSLEHCIVVSLGQSPTGEVLGLQRQLEQSQVSKRAGTVANRFDRTAHSHTFTRWCVVASLVEPL
jgi:hypothetical protein